MSKIWKNNVKVIRKFNLKQRLELKLTALVVKNVCPNFPNLASPRKFSCWGPAQTIRVSNARGPLILASTFVLIFFMFARRE